MGDITTPEIRVSKNPKIQPWVDRQKDYLRTKNPNADENVLNQWARDRVAARLKLERRAKELDMLKQESETDPLTRIANRRGFDRRVNEEVDRMKRTGSKCVLVTLDVNGLKATNDAHGHLAGDQLLRDTAEALRQGSRSIDAIARLGIEDPVARIGGDEFCVLLPQTDLEGAEIWWERVSSLLNNKGIKICAGAAELDPGNILASWKASDQALYEAKKISYDRATSNGKATRDSLMRIAGQQDTQ